jgi:F0F1-type ATP synthase epsilon subunit
VDCWGVQGGFAFKHANNTLVLNAPEGVRVSDIDGDRVKAEADALEAKRATAVRQRPGLMYHHRW